MRTQKFRFSFYRIRDIIISKYACKEEIKLKKKYTVAAVVLAAVMMFTGCSWDDITAKFVGDGATASGTATVSGGPIVMEDYDPAECVTLGNYKGVEVDCTVTSEEVQQQVDNVLMQHSTVEQIKKGKCKSGQSVNIDYTDRKSVV